MPVKRAIKRCWPIFLTQVSGCVDVMCSLEWAMGAFWLQIIRIRRSTLTKARPDMYGTSDGCDVNCGGSSCYEPVNDGAAVFVNCMHECNKSMRRRSWRHGNARPMWESADEKPEDAWSDDNRLGAGVAWTLLCSVSLATKPTHNTITITNCYPLIAPI